MADVSTLTNLIVLGRVGADLAAGRLWQNAAKTTPAVIATDPVRVATSPVGTPVDLTAPADGNRPVLGQDVSGLWYVQTDGTDALAATVAAAGAIGTGDYHVWAWLYLTGGTSGNCALFGSDNQSNPNGLIIHDGTLQPRTGTISGPGSISTGAWNLFQTWRVSGTVSLRLNNGSVTTGSESSVTVSSLKLFANYFGGAEAPSGSRAASWGHRSSFTAGDDTVVYDAGASGSSGGAAVGSLFWWNEFGRPVCHF